MNKTLLLFGLVYYIRVGGRLVKCRQGKSQSLDSLGSEQVLLAVVSSQSNDNGVHHLSARFCHTLLPMRQLTSHCNAPAVIISVDLTHHD